MRKRAYELGITTSHWPHEFIPSSGLTQTIPYRKLKDADSSIQNMVCGDHYDLINQEEQIIKTKIFEPILKKYLCATNSDKAEQRDIPQAWEEFEVDYLTKDRIAIKSHHGNYLSA